jgi:hypothetical protein
MVSAHQVMPLVPGAAHLFNKLVLE